MIDINFSIYGNIVFITVILTLVWIFALTNKDWKQNTVKYGCAEFVMDPATGKSDWQWLDSIGGKK